MKYQNLELPLYRSHKIVGALKIAKAYLIPGTSNCRITYEDQQFLTDFADLTGKPTPRDGWYMVWYEDGYFSFSPPEAFEQGYDRIEAENAGWSGGAHQSRSLWREEALQVLREYIQGRRWQVVRLSDRARQDL